MNKVIEYLRSKVSKDDYIIVGVSGGSDSMSLLHLLITLRDTISFNIVCAHVNHKKRFESDAEAIFLKEYCIKNNVIFESIEFDQYTKDNFHNQARHRRYQYFKELVNKYHAKYLMTAHHGDDLMETILMRLVRGSSLRGYAGFEMEIKHDNYSLLRPLVLVDKETIMKYIALNNIEYVTDKSNEEDIYTRNRFRKEVIPFLKNENKDVLSKFIKFSDMIYQCDIYIDNELNKIIEKVYINNEIKVDEFLKIDLLLQNKLLNRILKNIYKDNINLINDEHINNIIALINNVKPNASLYLPNKIRVIKTYNYLKFDKVPNVKIDYRYKLEDGLDLPNGMHIQVVSSSDNNSNYIARLNSNEIELPLWVRNRKEGDKMELKGIKGSKKIKDIFIDAKISTDLRNNYPIVTDNRDVIVFIPGLKKSKYDKDKLENYDIIIKCD